MSTFNLNYAPIRSATACKTFRGLSVGLALFLATPGLAAAQSEMARSEPQRSQASDFKPASTPVAAADASTTGDWQLMTSDFNTRPMNLTAITPSEIRGTIDGKPAAVPLAEVVQISSSRAIQATPQGLVLCVGNGDRLVGTPVGIENNKIIWKVADAGEVAVPLGQVLAVLRDKSSDKLLQTQQPSDRLLLNNGDTLNGVVTNMNATEIEVTTDDSTAHKFAHPAVKAMFFATPPGGRQVTSAAPFVVRLLNGSVLSVLSVTGGDTSLVLEPPEVNKLKSPLRVGLSQIVSIEQNNGPVRWLPSQEVLSSDYAPYFSGDFMPKIDRTVDGQPLKFAGRTYQHGIGMHSRTRMSWTLRPDDRLFRTRYAIDPALEYANVDVSILVDDKPVHSKKGFTAGLISPVVEVEVNGGKTLTLLIDYGSGYDVQDRVMWLDPALIRNKSATQPTGDMKN